MSICLCGCLFACLTVPSQNTHFQVSWRFLYKGQISNIGLRSHNFCVFFVWHLTCTWRPLLWIMGKLAGKALFLCLFAVGCWHFLGTSLALPWHFNVTSVATFFVVIFFTKNYHHSNNIFFLYWCFYPPQVSIYRVGLKSFLTLKALEKAHSISNTVFFVAFLT